MCSQRVKYRLNNEFDNEIELNFDPIGWNEDERELSRSMKSLSVFTTLSNSLEFVKDGAAYITDTYDRYGTEVTLTLTRLIKHPQTDEWEVDYIGNLDLKTYSIENEKVKVKFLTGGLQSVVTSQKREKFELSRETDIQGNEITPIEYQRMIFGGRTLELRSDLRPTEDNEYSIATYSVMPVAKTFADDNNVTSIIPTDVNRIQDTFSGDIDSLKFLETEMFYQRNDTDRTIEVTVHFNDIIFGSNPSANDDLKDVNVFLCLLTDDNFDGIFDIQERRLLANFNVQNDNPELVYSRNGLNYHRYNKLINTEIDLDEGVGLGIFFARGFEPNRAVINKDSIIIKTREDSVFPKTENNALRVLKVGERLAEIYTGKRDRFISTFFANQEDRYIDDARFSNALISSGDMIRNIADSTIKISFDELIGLDSFFNIGWGIERFGNIDKIVVEEINHFFSGFIALDLSDEDIDIKRSVANDFLFSSMTFGNEEAGQYEELQGLTEYNAKTSYTSHLTTADGKYDKISKVRADIIGAELSRRKQYESFPTTDTPYDEDNFIFDCNKVGESYTLRRFQDDYESVEGIFSPETAANLALTPFRSMERHSYIFNSGLTKYQDESTMFANSTGNAELITKKPNEVERAENSDIVNNELLKPLFVAEYLEFEYPLTYDISKQLRGKTVVRSREIPNTNGLVKIKSKGQIYYGWLMSLKFNDGSFKLIKANI